MKHHASRTPPAGRDLWPDVAKGACIILVVLWHVVTKHFAYLGAGEDWPATELWRQIGLMLQPLRMPVFFAVAGMFAASALARPIGDLMRTKIARFTYLYVVWVLIHTAVMAFTPDVPTIHATNGRQLVELLTVNPTNLWFLYALPIYFAVARLVRPLPAAWVLAAAFLLSAAASSQLVMEPSNRSQVVQNLLFFLVGLYGREVLRRLARRADRWLLLLQAALYGACVAAMYALGAETWFGVWAVVSVLGVALGVTAAAVAAQRPGRATTVVAYLGRRTLPIYVIHLALFAVGDQIARRLDIVPTSQVYVAVGPVVATTVLIAGCLALEQVLRAARLGFLLEPPFADRAPQDVGDVGSAGKRA